jgi:hypothetical protein
LDSSRSATTSTAQVQSVTANPEIPPERACQAHTGIFRRALEYLVLKGVPKPKHSLATIAAAQVVYQADSPFVARRTAIFALAIFALHSGISLYSSIGVQFSETLASPLFILWGVWAVYQLARRIKYIANWIYFILNEIDILKANVNAALPSSCSTQSLAAASRAPAQTMKSTRSSIAMSTLHSRPLDQDDDFHSPLRRDTEHDVGLIPIRRPTFPSSLE